VAIRNRLLLGYFGVIVILMASGALIIDRMSGELGGAVRRDAQALAIALREKVGLALDARIQAIQAFAGTSRQLQAALAASNAEFAARGSEAEVRAAILAADGAWQRAVERTPPEPTPLMTSLLENEVSAGLRKAMEYFRNDEGQLVFAEIFVTNMWGVNVGQTGLTSDYLQSDEGWWTGARDQGVWASSLVSKDESAHVYSVDIGIRIDDAEGSCLGVLKAVLNIEDVRRTIDAFAARSGLPDAFVEIIDPRGHVVHRQSDDKAYDQDLSSDVAVARALRGEAGTVIESTPRGELFRAYAPARDGGSPVQWALVLNQPTSEVFSHADELRRWMIGVGVLASLAAVLLGLFLTRSFGRITQRLAQARTALEQNEARLRSVVEGAVDGIVTIRSDGIIESVNPAVCAIFGYEAEELLGRNVSVVIPGPHGKSHDSYIQRYLRSGEAHILGTAQQLEGLRRDGTTFPLDLSVSEVRAGDLRLFVGIMRDVTEREQARHALEAAKEAAEAASRSKGQFLANMSHELRTPLNAIIGYAEMVAEELEERDEPELVSDVGKVRTAGKHLLGLINDILDVSKIEAGRMELHFEQVDVQQFLLDVVTTVQPLMEQNGNELVLEAADALGQVQMDVTKLRQILFNLLSNAAKFTREGRVTLEARRVEGVEHDWLELRVLDTGIGMSAEQLEHVWEAFSQADSSTTRQFGGTGLGLTISRSFCEMLGGTIDVESTLGAGTGFTLQLPAIETVGLRRGRRESRALTATPDEPRAVVDTVLVIDDDPAARDLVRRFLARQGIRVVGASNGREGLRLAALLAPTAIILDVMMPGMDGWAVLDSLKGNPELVHIPVIMLSMVDERQLGFALGVDAYITKPVDRARLNEVLAPYRLDSASHSVLVVEDDADARSLLERRLTRLGWQVIEAQDGVEAFERLEDVTPDIILTDLMMPRMDGFEFIDRLRREDRWRGIPVLVLTSKDITASDAARLEGAIEHLLQKGAYDRDALMEEIGRLVRIAMLRRRARG